MLPQKNGKVNLVTRLNCALRTHHPPQHSDYKSCVVVTMPSSPRRSGRDRKSTITYIGGQAVLKTNNYVVKGTTYVYSKDDAQQAAPVKRVVQHQPSTTKEPKKPRLATPAELGRRAHNASVEQQKASKQAARQSFLRQHDHILQPFMADSVWNQIQSYPQITHNYDPVYQQPSEITGELRDYQLLGLDFMVRNHKQNLGMILGDEMGLVRNMLWKHNLHTNLKTPLSLTFHYR
jgi:hypothetical protein